MSASGENAYAVPGRDDLRCPVPRHVVKAMLAHAQRAPVAPGNEPLRLRAALPGHHGHHRGRAVRRRVLLSVDVGYHGSGWFANS